MVWRALTAALEDAGTFPARRRIYHESAPGTALAQRVAGAQRRIRRERFSESRVVVLLRTGQPATGRL